jgi:hypothetical protein
MGRQFIGVNPDKSKMKLRADVIEKLNPSSGMDASRWFTRYELFVDLCYEEMWDEEKADCSVA